MLVIKKLSKLLSKIQLNLTLADEDEEKNYGKIIYKNGGESTWYYTDRKKEIAEIYKDCWGMPPFEEVLCYDEFK